MAPVTMTPRGTAALTAYLVVAVTNVGSLALGLDPLANLTQWLLMPLLLAVFLVTPPGRIPPAPPPARADDRRPGPFLAR